MSQAALAPARGEAMKDKDKDKDEEQDFRPRPERVLRQPAAAPVDPGWEARLWRHHLGHDVTAANGALRPALLDALLQGPRACHPFPALSWTGPDGLRAEPLVDTLVAALAETALPSAPEHAARLARAVADALDLDPGPLDAREAVARAGEALRARARSGSPALDEALAALATRVPAGARVHGPQGGLALDLLLQALAEERAPREARLRDEVARLAGALRELLLLDHLRSPEARSARAVGSSLGPAGAGLVDPGRLAATLPSAAASEPLSLARRERLEGAVAALEAYLAPPAWSAVHLVEASEQSPRPLASAIHLFDVQAADLAAVVRAMRVARLEVAGAYREELHDAPLAQLDWQSFSTDELLVVPAIVALEDERRLRGEGRTLDELARSGRPVRVVARVELAGTDPLERPLLGATALQLGELFVAQVSLARPGEVADACRRAARALGPALVLVDRLDLRVERPELWAAAAREARAWPGFFHDPAAGASWLDRLALAEQEQPDRTWPVHALACRDAAGAPATLELAFTFADAAALHPAWRDHFLVLPPEAWSERLAPVDRYLAAFEGREPPALVPFVWVTDDAGALCRAAVSRELAFACRQRAATWRALQELTGLEGELARRVEVASRARVEAALEAQRQELAATHAQELERVRAEATRQAIEQVVGALVGGAVVAAPTNGGAVIAPPANGGEKVVAPPATSAAPAAPAAPIVAAAPVADDEPPLDTPWIDTPSCSSCSDCVNLNPLLFKYDRNKQAVIADATKGTFLELVTAAEKCPVKCIHTGKPRDGDASATPDVVARAAGFR